MAIDDCFGKRNAFKEIVGQEPYRGGYPGDVPDYSINPEQVDNIYLTVKKMQRCYCKMDHPSDIYYAESFSLVEKAYLFRDFEGFSQAVRRLMIDIDED